MPPNASTVAATSRSRSAASVRSPATASAPMPRRLALDDVAAPGEHRHVRPFGGERLGDREAHALRGAQHDGGASLKSEVHGARSVPGRTVHVAQRRGQVSRSRIDVRDRET